MKAIETSSRCLGYFETTSQEDIYEICNMQFTNTELILDTVSV